MIPNISLPGSWLQERMNRGDAAEKSAAMQHVKTVHPDADDLAVLALRGARLNRLKQLGEIEVCPGAPPDNEEYCRRVGIGKG